jgi:H+/Cl- antiporter ClcA
MLEFFGIFALVNGVLFGLFSVLAITGLTSLKTWDEINLVPKHTLLVCVILIIAGTVIFLTGRISNRSENRHGNNPSPVS